MRADPREYGLLVVSDLHLSEGRRERTKRFSRYEDFFFDQEFARFLRHYQDAARWDGARWHLVINGDFLDLLQVVSTEGAAPTLHLDRDHPEFGLSCGAAESVFKLHKVVTGHWQLFEALAAFVAAGNLLTILKGNHDVEFHYRDVQRAFIDELRAALAGVAPRAGAPSAASIDAATVRFGDWFHHEEGLIWIEHGNRYDGANSFRQWLAPLLPDRPDWPSDRKDDIDLPLGSMFVRYLFNRIETVEPFADNIKPQTRFVRWLLARHPITALRFLLHDGRYMLGKLRRACAPLPAAAFRTREQEHRHRLQQLAVDAGIDPGELARVDALRARNVLEETTGLLPRCAAAMVRAGVVLPAIWAALAAVTVVAVLAALQTLSVVVPPVGRFVSSTAALRGVIASGPWALLLVLVAAVAVGLRWALAPEQPPAPDALLAPANQIASRLGVRYVVMGHTHDAQLRPLANGGEYYNTGTWTKVFSEEERLIRDDVEFVFLQGVRRGPRDLQLKLMEWIDEAGEPRLLKLFEDGERDRTGSARHPNRGGGP